MNHAEVPPQIRIMRLAFAVALVLVAIKAVAFVITGSIALLASLIDSAVDGLASAVGWFAVRQAQVPPDHDHRFGHGKIESIAALGQAAFIIGTAALLLLQAAQRLLAPQPLEHTAVGIGVTLIALVMTGLLIRAQQRAIRETSSVVVQADSVHYVADFLGYIGVLVALIASGVFGVAWADPLIGAAIALYLLLMAVRVGRLAFDELLDRELDDADRERIINAARSVEGVDGVHDLRTRRAGPQVFIQLHAEVDGDTPLARAHAITNAVAAAVRGPFPDADVLIHADPDDDSDEPLPTPE